MKKSLLLLFLLAIGGGLNTAEAQPVPVRVGYTPRSGGFSPIWIAKELDLFERQGVQSTPIYMAATLAYQAMLAGETDFTVGTGMAPAQARLGGADPIILLTYIIYHWVQFFRHRPPSGSATRRPPRQARWSQPIWSRNGLRCPDWSEAVGPWCCPKW